MLAARVEQKNGTYLNNIQGDPQSSGCPTPVAVFGICPDRHSHLRDGRPPSSCRRLFLRTLAPHVGFASGCAITMIAKTALERAGIRGYAHHGAHIFRHSLATKLLRSGATLSEIGQLLRHESHDTTRIYAKVDIDALRTLSLPWPGGVQ
jgi:integrase